MSRKFGEPVNQNDAQRRERIDAVTTKQRVKSDLNFSAELFEDTHAEFRIAILVIGVISLVAFLRTDRKRWL
jgi:hypothetical protein